MLAICEVAYLNSYMSVDWPLLIMFLGFAAGVTLFLRCLRVILRRLSDSLIIKRSQLARKALRSACPLAVIAVVTKDVAVSLTESVCSDSDAFGLFNRRCSLQEVREQKSAIQGIQRKIQSRLYSPR